MKNRAFIQSGFTLFELVVVLAIISVMMMVIIPYARRSNESLQLKEDCLNVTELIKYALDLATHTKRTTKIVINPQDNSYWLEIVPDTMGNKNCEPLDNFLCNPRYFNKNARLTDITGFDTESNKHYIVFDPAKQWPDASFSLSVRDLIETIKINGRQVELEESAI
jgi:prepilin-type N-terminal cleavage/methylation domain-containing protein